MAAPPRALEDHPVAFADAMGARRVRADGRHPPEDLVTQDHGQRQVDAAAVVLHVGPAHPAELDGEQRALATDVRDGVFADLELAGGQQRGGPTRCLHGFPPPSFDGFPAAGYCIPPDEPTGQETRQ